MGIGGVLALAAALASGLVPGPSRRELLWLRLAGLTCFLFALGQSVWQHAHDHLPYFKSQHIPSRLLLPGVLCLSLALVGAAAERWRRLAATRRWAEPLLVGLVGLYALDLAIVARQATDAPFRLQVPEVRRAPAFAQLARGPYRYGKPAVAERRLRERYDWPSRISYPTMLANQGLVRCYGVPLEVTSTVAGSDQPGYRGLAYLAGGQGAARVVDWTPNAVSVEISGARPGDMLIYDMNFDAGWRVDFDAGWRVDFDAGWRVDEAGARLAGARGRARRARRRRRPLQLPAARPRRGPGAVRGHAARSRGVRARGGLAAARARREPKGQPA